MKVGKFVCVGAIVLSMGSAIAGDLAGEDVILVSNARVAVTRAEFEMEVEARVPSDNRAEFLMSLERINKVLEEILVRKTLAAEARELGLDKQPLIRFKTEKAQENVLVAERMDYLKKAAKLPDLAIRANEIYKLNSEKYTIKPMVRAYHVLIGIKNRSKEEALILAQEVHAQALKGADFEELVLKYSDDEGSKSQRGDLGYFPHSAMVKPFADAAFALKVGALSAPVETKFGYHVIKLIDAKPESKQEFEAVKGKIVKELEVEYLNNLATHHTVEIRVDKKMKINEEEIMKIKTERPAVGVTK